MAVQKLGVFVSSTSKGLQSYRNAVVNAVSRVEACYCINMENFGASPNAPLATCLAKVEEADIFVGLIGPHYGSIPRGQRKSFTELEYEKARQLGKPRLIYITPEDFATSEREREPSALYRKQKSFRNSVSSDVARETFPAGEENGLAIRVVSDLANQLLKNTGGKPAPASTLVPAPMKPDTSPPIWQRLARHFSVQRGLIGAAGLLAIVLAVLGVQHVVVATHRFPANEAAVPAGDYHLPVDHSPMLGVLRELKDVGNLETLLEPQPAVVTLPAFFIDRTEVTNAAYRDFLSTQPGRATKTPDFLSDARVNAPAQPVVGVDWNDANAFCLAQGKRLPSGDEWERAARGRAGRMYPWGNRFDPAAANTSEGPIPATTPVGAMAGDRTPEGVMDMGGNVREWTSDAMARDKGSPIRFVRGASFLSRGRIYALSFLAIPADPDVRKPDLGFRCAADATDTADPPAGMAFIRGGPFQKGGEDQRLLDLARKYNLAGSAIHRLIDVPQQPGAQPAFGMDRTEVSNADYRKFLDSAGDSTMPPRDSGQSNYQPNSRTWGQSGLDQPDQPVVGVTWYDADAYCRWRGEHLPSASEWQRAAGGLSGTRYPWGDEYEADRCNAADSVHPEGRPVPVGKYARCTTPSGILDPVGNVDEWTASDTTLDDGTAAKLTHGGSWEQSGELHGLVTYGSAADPRYSGPDIGFRCAANPRRSWLEKFLAGVF